MKVTETRRKLVGHVTETRRKLVVHATEGRRKLVGHVTESSRKLVGHVTFWREPPKDNSFSNSSNWLAGTWKRRLFSISPCTDSVFVGQWLSGMHCPPAQNSGQIEKRTFERLRRQTVFTTLLQIGSRFAIMLSKTFWSVTPCFEVLSHTHTHTHTHTPAHTHTHTHNFNRVGMRRWLVVIIHPCRITWQYACTILHHSLLHRPITSDVSLNCRSDKMPCSSLFWVLPRNRHAKKMNYLQSKAIFTHNSNALWCTQLRLTAMCSTYGWL